MLPLKLCWAWTIWKAQGQTIKGKVVADISSKEREHGLTYTAFSRVTVFSNFGLYSGISHQRLVQKILQHKKMQPRIDEEQRLSRLADLTMRKFEELFGNN